MSYAEEEPSGLGVFLKRSSGTVERLSHEAIEQGIQMRRILPWDLVSEDNREFHPISDNPEFRNLFLRSDFVPVMQPHCSNHPDASPAGTCRKCGRSFCATCVQEKLRIQPRLCPCCSGVVADPDPRLREIPPWKRPNEIARFPVAGNAFIGTVAMGALLWLAGASWFAIPLYLVALVILLDIVLRSAKGARSWPIVSGIDFPGMKPHLLPVLLLSVAISIPFRALPYVFGPSVGVFLQFPLTLALFFYFPMAMGLVIAAEDKDSALRPKAVFRAIWAVRDEYFVYLALFVAVEVAVVLAMTIFSFLPWIHGLLQSIALAYGRVLQAHLLGFFLYMNRERLRAAV
jgi:hypothetical protein